MMRSPSNYRCGDRGGLNLRSASSMLEETNGGLSKTSCFTVALRVGSCMHCVYWRDENMMSLDIHQTTFVSAFFCSSSGVCHAPCSLTGGSHCSRGHENVTDVVSANQNMRGAQISPQVAAVCTVQCSPLIAFPSPPTEVLFTTTESGLIHPTSSPTFPLPSALHTHYCFFVNFSASSRSLAMSASFSAIFCLSASSFLFSSCLT